MDTLSDKAMKYQNTLKKYGKLNYEECFVMEKRLSGVKMNIHEYLEKLVDIYGKI